MKTHKSRILKFIASVILSAYNLCSGLAAQRPGTVPEITPQWSGACPGVWTMDGEAALENAKDDQRWTLMLFSAMWWCPHCIPLEQNVLTSPVFSNYVESAGYYLAVYDFPARDGVGRWCWLFETNYVESAGMTMVQAQKEIDARYAVQDAYAVPGAAKQSVSNWNSTAQITYGRIGYPTILVVRPNGTVAGRFSYNKAVSAASAVEYVTNRIEQIKLADDFDEADDYWQGAADVKEPSCDGEMVTNSCRTLSIVDVADWYRIDVDAGASMQWSFGIVKKGAPFVTLKMEVFSDPTTLPIAELSVGPESEEHLSCLLPSAGSYYVKVSPEYALDNVVEYALAFQYASAPVNASFSSSAVTVASTAQSIDLNVSLRDVSQDSAVALGWITRDGTALGGLDYESGEGVLVWEIDERKTTTKKIRVPLKSVTEWKGDRTFTVHLYQGRHCQPATIVATCQVTIKERRTRKAGLLSFDSSLKNEVSVLKEGIATSFWVHRSGGADGVVTGVVTVAEGSSKNVFSQSLVWEHGDSESKVFTYTPSFEAGVQQPMPGTVKLVASGGAKVGTPSSVKIERVDALMEEEFKVYNKNVLESKAAVSGGFWFYGMTPEKTEKCFRSSELTSKGSILTIKCAGPGVLRLKLRLFNGAKATISSGSEVLEAGVSNDIERVISIPVASVNVKIVLTKGGDGSYSAADWEFVKMSDFKLSALMPFDKTVVRISDFDRLKAVAAGRVDVPAWMSGRLRCMTYAGLNSSRVNLLNEESHSDFIVGENVFPSDERDRENLSSLIDAAVDKKLYWRMDAVFKDDYNVEAVQKGTVASFSVVSDSVPRVDLTKVADSRIKELDFEAASIRFAPLTVGVATKIGPLPLAGAESAESVSLALLNGSLPSGLKAIMTDGGIMIEGVPTKDGEFSVDIRVSSRVKDGRRLLTLNGATVRLFLSVVPLGDIVSMYEGHRVVLSDSASEFSVGAGAASISVSKTGGISGKATVDGVVWSFSAKSFTELSDGVYHLYGCEAKKGREVMPVSLDISLVNTESRYYDGQLKIGDAIFWLYANVWKNNDPVAKYALTGVAGYYTAALPVLVRDPSTLQTGNGFMTVTVKNSGQVVYSGEDPSGKSFSGTTSLLFLPDCCNILGYKFAFYISTKPSGYSQAESGLSGLVTIQGENNSATGPYLTTGAESGLSLVNLNPKSVREYTVWTNRLDVIGGLYDKKKALPETAAWCMDGALPIPEDFDGAYGESGYHLSAVPDSFVLKVNSPTKVTYSSESHVVTVRSFSSATGLMTSRMILDYVDYNGKLKKRNVDFKSVYVQTSQDDGAFWSGSVGMPEKVSVIDQATGKNVTYSVTVFYPLWLMPFNQTHSLLSHN